MTILGYELADNTNLAADTTLQIICKSVVLYMKKLDISGVL
jgi:hypothetical protein